MQHNTNIIEFPRAKQTVQAVKNFWPCEQTPLTSWMNSVPEYDSMQIKIEDLLHDYYLACLENEGETFDDWRERLRGFANRILDIAERQ